MWTAQDSEDLYLIKGWGDNFFHVNSRGHVAVHPTQQSSIAIDLKILVDEVRERGIQLPILFRFSDILRQRIIEMHTCFRTAISETSYKGSYQGVYPIKVNQQKQVVESIVAAGHEFDYGLEAGSKPELLTVMGIIKNPNSLIICNGYKDEEFVALALAGRKLGLTIILVIEKISELELIFKVAKRMGVKPVIGIRARLSSRGAGRWEASGGDQAKFGLNALDILKVVAYLTKVDQLDSLQLLHYHLGSQICSIGTLRGSLREAGRYYIELIKMGCELKYFDVGGGLAVDYDGSRTDYQSSSNYSMQEYANTVVYELGTMCNENDVAHPRIVSESGRAITAHHSILVTDILEVTESPKNDIPEPDLKDAPTQVAELWACYQKISHENFQETYHEIQDMREQLLNLFKLGFISLHWRAIGESIIWASLHQIFENTRRADYVPDELDGLERELADIYFCNLSVFQSLPDSWAIGMVFPIMPIHRLDEKPQRIGVFADITCDSDGKIDKFVDLRDARTVLPLHALKNDEDYLIGFFLVGAYQEILGDLHNLFGDNNAVHISWDPETKSYNIDHVEDGDTVTEVLNYVQHSKTELINQFRRRVENALRYKKVSIEESRTILELYRDGFEGYTYIER